MKEYVGMVGVQIAQALLVTVSKYAMADGMSNYSFTFYSNALASLVLLPLALIFHRSANRPPLTFIILCGFFIIGLLGMEPVDVSSTTLLKFIGVVVSITGAIIMTLYKGPSILPSLSKSKISPDLLVQQSNWVLGGIFIAIASIFASIYMIVQTTVLRLYPAEMIVMFTYCFVSTILSALASLIVEADLSSFSLKPKIRLLSIIYSGIFGSAFQVTVQAWCIRKRGPLFVVMFQPVGIVISTFVGVIFLGDGVDLGSLLGSITVVIGFYTVMWGKAKEKIVSVNNGGSSKLPNEETPLLLDVAEEDITCSST